MDDETLLNLSIAGNSRKVVLAHLEDMVRVANSDDAEFDVRRNARMSILVGCLLLTDKDDHAYPGDLSREFSEALVRVNKGSSLSDFFEAVH